jgi:hypothetical protein
MTLAPCDDSERELLSGCGGVGAVQEASLRAVETTTRVERGWLPDSSLALVGRAVCGPSADDNRHRAPRPRTSCAGVGTTSPCQEWMTTVDCSSEPRDDGPLYDMRTAIWRGATTRGTRC